MDHKKIILSEPHSRLRSKFQVELLRDGREVFLAEDELDMLQLARSHKPGLALVSTVETGSCELNPFDATTALVRARLVRASVMTASRPTREIAIRAAKAGALGFVANAATQKELLKVMDRAYDRASKGGSALAHQEIQMGEEMSLADKVKQIAQKAKTLRAMPAVANKILQITEGSEHGAQQLSLAVEADPSIAAVVLRRARSAGSAGGKSVEDLKQAIIRIGFKETQQLVLSLSLVKLVSRKELSFGFNRHWYWLHSLACGILAKMICRQSRIAGGEDAFLAGLLHDIGKAFLDDFLTDEYQLVVQKANIDRTPVFESERNLLKLDHAALGAEIAFQWAFPESITDAIGVHHDTDLLGSEDENAELKPELSGAVCLANHMAKALLVGCGGDFIVPELPPRVWEAYGFRSAVDEAFLEKFSAELNSFSSLWGLGSGDIGMGNQIRHPAVIVESKTSSSLISRLVLSSLGCIPTEVDDLAALSKRTDRPLCLLHTQNLNAAMSAVKVALDRGLDLPMICVIHSKGSTGSIALDDERPWIRGIFSPLDCFELATTIEGVINKRRTEQ